jgi:alpha-tubulin suppressor-like RCC1 family protein/uncharacterized protein YjdB
MNKIFVNNNIPDYETFISAVNVPIQLDLNINSIDQSTNRIGFVWENNYGPLPFGDIYNDQYTFFSQEFINYLSEYKSNITIDFITCSLNKLPNFINELSIIKELLPNITFNYSINQTGNSPGDWIMESSNENIKKIYFNDNIINYTYILEFNNSYSLVLSSDNSVYMTGQSPFDILSIKTVLPSNKVVKKIACGADFTIVLMTDNTVYSTGNNQNGQLGLNNFTNRQNLTSVFIPDSKIVKDIYNSNGSKHTLFLMSDNTVYGTGLSNFGQLGMNNKDNLSFLTYITTLPFGKTIQNIYCGSFHTIFLMNDNTVFACGNNQNGQLGLDNTNETLYITSVTIPIGKIIKNIVCGNNFTIFLMSDNTVYATGSNEYGQLGLPGTSNRLSLSLVTIPSNKNVKNIYCGNLYTMYLMTDNTVFYTGLNSIFGVSTSYVSSLTSVSIPVGKTVKDIVCGLHCMFLMSDNTVYGLGSNSSGQLGFLGNFSSRSILTYVDILPTNKIVKNIYCGSNHTMFLTSDNTIYSVGLNNSGQLGTVLQTLAKIDISGYKQIEYSDGHVLVLMNDNTVKGYGSNSSGVFGFSDTSIRKYANNITIPTGKTVKTIYCSNNNSIFLMTDNTVYGCGINNSGQLGLGYISSVVSNLTSIPIPTNKTVKNIYCGNTHLMFLMTDNSVFSCGTNSFGQLGLGNTTPMSNLTPVTIPNGKIIKKIICGTDHTAFLMTDNSVFACGYNIFQTYSTLVSYILNLSSIQMPAGKTVENIYTGRYNIYYLMSDKTVYTNGFNFVTIPLGKTVKKIRCCLNHALFLMTDNTIYAIGLNSSYQLGINTQIDSNVLVPMIIPTLNNNTYFYGFSKGLSKLSNFTINNRAWSDIPFTITQPTIIAGDGILSYTSSNPSIATINSSTGEITMLNAGSVTIIATLSETNTYEEETISTTFVISKLKSNLLNSILSNFTINNRSWSNVPFTLNPPTTIEGNGTLSYISNDTSVATVNNTTGVITMVGTGSVIITSIISETTQYNLEYISTTFEISKSSSILSNFTIDNRVWSDISFIITPPTINAGNGSILYVSNNTSIANIDSLTGLITMKNTGSVTITATISETNQYNSSNISTTFIISKSSSNLSNFTISNRAWSNIAFTLTPPTIITGNGLISYVSNDTSIATINSSTGVITMVKAGVVTITATISETNEYNSSNITSTFTISKLSGNLSNFTISNRSWSNVPFTLIPPTKNDSNGLLSYTSSNSSIATINSSTGEITMLNAGSVTITSTLSETDQYNGVNISATFVISKLNSNLLNSILSNFTINNRSWSNVPFTLVPPEIVAGNGSISYISNDTSIATINNTTNELTMLKAGSVIITAIISETNEYNLEYISTPFVISKVSSNLSNFVISDRNWTSVPFTITPPTIIAGNGTLSYASNDTSIATINSTTGVITILKQGTITITATISETDQYNLSNISSLFIISNQPSNLSNFTINNRSWSNIPFTILPPTIIDGDGVISYKSSNLDIVTIDTITRQITMLSAGTVTITATIAATAYYSSSEITSTFTISKLNSNLSNFTISNRLWSNIPFILTPPTIIAGNGLLSYVSSNTTIAKINSITGLITMVKTGSVTITATISSTNQYNSSTITATFVISKLNSNLTNFTISNSLWSNVPFRIIPPTIITGNGLLSYVSSNTTIATINNSTGIITMLKAGSVTITTTISETDQYNSSNISTPFVISKSSSNLSNFTISNRSWSDVPFTLTPPTIIVGNGSLSYISSDTSIATINSSTGLITMLKAGSVTITANISETEQYNSANISATFVISKLNSNLLNSNLSNFTINNRTWSNVPFTITPPTIIAGNGSLSYISNDTSIATINSITREITMIKAGSVTITAILSETELYNAVYRSTTFVISKLNSNLSNFTISNRSWSNVPFTLTHPTIIAGNGSLSYISNDTSIATINSSTGEISMLKTGSVVIIATISETEQYNSSDISATFVISKINSSLSNFTISNRPWSFLSFTMIPPIIIEGNGSLSYISNDTSIATINNTSCEITMVKAGSVTITATITGTDKYNSSNISTTFVISKLNSSLSNFTINNRRLSNVPFTLIPPTIINGNGTLSYVSNNTSIATINSLTGVITMLNVGSVTITATISETNQYNSSTISATFVISKISSNLSNFTISNRAWSNIPFTLTPPTIITGNGLLSYISSNTNIATINSTTGEITMLNAGSVTITATISETDLYETINISTSFVISKLNSNLLNSKLSNFIINNRVWSNIPFKLISPTIITGNGSLSYISNDSSIATINSLTGIITMLKSGLVTITAILSETNEYNLEYITATFVISKVNSNLINFTISNYTLSTKFFTITPPIINIGNGSLSYISNDTSIVSINNTTGIISILKSGSVTITCILSETDQYNSSNISTTFVISKMTSRLSYIISNRIWSNMPFNFQPPIIEGNNTQYIYSTTTQSLITVSSTGVINMLKAGLANINVGINESDQYIEQRLSAGILTFEISKASSNLTNFTISNRIWSNIPFTLIPPTIIEGNGDISYVSNDPTIATINSTTGLITMLKAGSVTITATISETDQYNSSFISSTFVISKSSNNLSNFIINNRSWSNVPFTLTPPSINAGNGLLSYVSNDTSVANINSLTGVITMENSGSVTITAILSETTQTMLEYITTTFVISKINSNLLNSSLSNFTISNREWSNVPFTLIPPTIVTGNGTLSYISNDSSIATIDSLTGEITMLKAGSVIITAIISETSTYNLEYISTSFVISKLNSNLSNFTISNRPWTPDPFVLTPPTIVVGNGLLSYVSNIPSIARIESKTGAITMLQAGTVTITATISETDQYMSSVISATFVISKLNSVLSNFVISDRIFSFTSFILDAPYKDVGNGVISYVSNNTSIATINSSSGQISMVNRGVVTITATISETNQYNSSTISTTFVISKIPSILTNLTISNRDFSNVPFAITPPTITGNGTVSYISSDPSIATITSSTGIITMIKPGTISITATISETSLYNATSISATFEILKSTSILRNFTISNREWSEVPFTINPPTTIVGNGILSYISNDISIATVNSLTGEIIMLKGGIVTITAIISETEQYNTEYISTSFVIRKLNSNLLTSSLSNFSISDRLWSNMPFILSPPTILSGNGTISYISNNISRATINSVTGIITMHDSGAVTITAILSETNEYNLEYKTATFSISKISSILTNYTISNQDWSNISLIVNPPTILVGNGILSYVSNNPTVALINSSTGVVTMLKAGSVTMTAMISSTDTYEESSISTSFVISKLDSNISNLSISNRSWSNVSFTITPPTINIGNGTLSYTSNNLSIATINSSTGVITMLKAGSVTITATISETDQYKSASIITTFVISKASSILSNLVIPNKTYGDAPFNFNEVSVIGNGSVTYSSNNSEIATVSGSRLVSIIKAGTVRITATISETDQYLSSNIFTDLIISGKAITVTAGNQTKVYDGLIYNFVGSEFTVSDMIGTDTIISVSLSSSSVNVSGSPYIINVSNAVGSSTTLLSNYIISYLSGSLTITPRAIIIKGSNQTKSYNGIGYNVVSSGFTIESGSMVSGQSIASVNLTSSGINVSGSPYTLNVSNAVAGANTLLSNYVISYSSGLLTITKAELTITSDNKSVIYTGLTYNSTSVECSATYTGLLNGETSTVLGGTLGFTISPTPINVGEYIISASGLISVNYNINYNTGTLTITKANLTVTSDNKSVTYTGLVYNSTSAVCSVSYSGLLNGETSSVLEGPVVFTISNTPKNVGVYTITASGLNSVNYNISYNTGTLTITKANLTVKADNKSVTYTGLKYNSTSAGCSATYTGLLNDETSTVLEGVIVFTISNIPINVGGYTITASGLSSVNYNISYNTGILIINKANLTVTSDNKSVTYTGLTYNSTSAGCSVSYTGLMNGEISTVLGGTLVFTILPTPLNVGVYTITASGLSSGNYNISYNTGTLTINKANLTVTSDNKSVTYTGLIYNSTSAGCSATYTGLMNGESSTVLGGSLLFTILPTPLNVGEYTISVTGLISGNYNINYNTGTLTITKANLIVKADNKSVIYTGLTYNSTSAGCSVSYVGLLNGETSSVLEGPVVFTILPTPLNVGGYTITVSGLSSLNYNISYNTGTLTITPQALTIKALDQTKTYNGIGYNVVSSGFTIESGSMVSGQSISSVSLSCEEINVRSFPYILNISNAVAGANTLLSNYVISYSTGLLTITKADLTVTSDNKSVTYTGLVYNSTSAGCSATYTGLLNGETSTVLGGTLGFTISPTPLNVGVYIITVSGLISGNYNINYNIGTLTITKANLTVSADNKNVTYIGFVYNSKSAGCSVSYTGLLNGETSSVLEGSVVFTISNTPKNVGVYTITASELSSLNYNISYNTGTLTISKANLTVTSDNKSVPYTGLIYNSTSAGCSATYTGLLNGDTSTVLEGTVVFTISNTPKNVGEYTITASGVSSLNYNISYNTGTLTINKANLTVIANNKSVIYTGLTYNSTSAGCSATYTGLQNGETSSVLEGTLVFTISASPLNVGVYTISASGLSSINYIINYLHGSLTITPISITIKGINQTKTYNGSGYIVVSSGFTIESGSMVTGESISSVNLSCSDINVSETPYPIIVSNAVGGSNTLLSNYAISYSSGSLTILRKDLTIRALDQIKTFTGSILDLGVNLFSVVGLVGVESLSEVTLSSNGINSGTYPIIASNAVGNSGTLLSNYNIIYVTGLLSIIDVTTITLNNTVLNIDTSEIITSVPINTTTNAINFTQVLTTTYYDRLNDIIIFVNNNLSLLNPPSVLSEAIKFNIINSTTISSAISYISNYLKDNINYTLNETSLIQYLSIQSTNPITTLLITNNEVGNLISGDQVLEGSVYSNSHNSVLNVQQTFGSFIIEPNMSVVITSILPSTVSATLPVSNSLLLLNLEVNRPNNPNTGITIRINPLSIPGFNELKSYRMNYLTYDTSTNNFKSNDFVNGTYDAVSNEYVFVLPHTSTVSINEINTVMTGGDPIIFPIEGCKYYIAPHVKYVNLLADYDNSLFINAHIDMLKLSDFPKTIYCDNIFHETNTLDHIYKNSYYRKFYIKYGSDELIIDADRLIVKYSNVLNKIKLVKFKPSEGLKSATFNKRYPLLNTTQGLKIGIGKYLLTIVTDLKTDDRHFVELLNVNSFNSANLSGALISSSKITRISNLEGLELYENSKINGYPIVKNLF